MCRASSGKDNPKRAGGAFAELEKTPLFAAEVDVVHGPEEGAKPNKFGTLSTEVKGFVCAKLSAVPVLRIIPEVEPNDTGAVFDLVGNPVDDVIMPWVGAGCSEAIGLLDILLDVPNGVAIIGVGLPMLVAAGFLTGVGAFMDIGGVAATGVFDTPYVVPTGVGAFFDMGGNAALVGTAFVVLTSACDDLTEVETFADIGEKLSAGKCVEV